MTTESSARRARPLVAVAAAFAVALGALGACGIDPESVATRAEEATTTSADGSRPATTTTEPDDGGGDDGGGDDGGGDDGTTTTLAEGSRTVPWASLQVGQCVETLPTGTFLTVTLVACADPHVAEVFHRGQLSAADVAINGEDAAAEGACGAQFEPYTGVPVEGSDLSFSYLVSAGGAPTAPTVPGQTTLPPLDVNRFLVICVLVAADGSSLEGSRAR